MDTLTRTVIIKKAQLKRSTTFEKLALSLAHSSKVGALKELRDGRIGIFVGSVGFMALDYSVGIYEPRPLPFRPNRLKLVSEDSFYDEPKSAEARFARLV